MFLLREDKTPSHEKVKKKEREREREAGVNDEERNCHETKIAIKWIEKILAMGVASKSRRTSKD